MEAEARESVRRVALAYAEGLGLALSTVSRHVANDGRWLEDFLAGRISPRLKTIDDTLLWFSTNWPEGVKWPRGEKRPEAVSKSA
jgi:hypothetical protein